MLADNPWGDPVERDFNVYLPPGYDGSGAPFIALWDLAAFTNCGPGHLNWRNHGENLAQRLDRLIAEGKLPPVVVPMPDCYTSLGGNQYVNSSAVGRYADYLVDELVPLLSQQFNVVDSSQGRGVFGKSSGGYGALYHGMHYPDAWGAVAAHAADCGFDLLYRPAFPATSQVLGEHGDDPRRFIEVFWGKRQLSGRDFEALMTLAMAASYDPDEASPGRHSPARLICIPACLTNSAGPGGWHMTRCTWPGSTVTRSSRCSACTWMWAAVTSTTSSLVCAR